MDWREFFKLEEERARMVAKITGDSSAASLALEKLMRLRAMSMDAVIWSDAGSWMVGPRPVDDQPLP